MHLQRIAAVLTAAAVALAPAAGLAAEPAPVMNKEGYWAIDVDDGACAASLQKQGGGIFLLRGVDGKVTFAVFFDKPIRGGKRGQVQTEAYSFDFEPSFVDGNTAVFFNGDLDNRAIAALRLAEEVRVLVDGRLVHAATFENTGFDGALDALIACSKGEKGWWGPGLGGGKTAAAPPADGAEPAYNKEDVWSLQPFGVQAACIARARVDDHLHMELTASQDHIGIGIASDSALPRARKGLVRTEAYSFDFKPAYDPDGRDVYSEDWLDSQALFALRRAKGLQVALDGRVLVDVTLEGTGFPAILDEALACARGEKGWWGEGARQTD